MESSGGRQDRPQWRPSRRAQWPSLLVLLLVALPRGVSSEVAVTFPAGATRFRCSTDCIEETKCIEEDGCRVHSLDPSLDLGVGLARNGTFACSDKVCQPKCRDMPGCTRGQPSDGPKSSPLDAPLQLLPFRYADGRATAALWLTEDAVKLWDAASGEVASFRSFFCLKLKEVPSPSSSSSSSSKPGLQAPNHFSSILAFGIIDTPGPDIFEFDGGQTRRVHSVFNIAMRQEVIDGHVHHRARVFNHDEGPLSLNWNESVLGGEFFNRTFGVWVEYGAVEQVMQVSVLPLQDMSLVSFALAGSNMRRYARKVTEYKLDLRSAVNEYSHIGFVFATINSSDDPEQIVAQIFYWHFQTDGAGTHFFLVVGAVVVVAGLLVLWMQTRRRRYSSSSKYSAAAALKVANSKSQGCKQVSSYFADNDLHERHGRR